MESLTLCHVSIFSNYLHFNYEQILYTLNNASGNLIELFKTVLWCQGVCSSLDRSRSCEKIITKFNGYSHLNYDKHNISRDLLKR